MNNTANQKATLVLGASDNPDRYSYMAIQRLTRAGHPVVAIGRKAGIVAQVPISTEWQVHQGVDTVTLYLNPGAQVAYYDRILALKPRRVIFNPGTENEELEVLLRQQHIQTVEACTLTMISTHQY